MNARYLIVNADDFGLTQSVNGAIEELFRLRAVTSATILAPARFGADACRIAAESGLAAGVHWTLNSEWTDEPWLPCAGDTVPSLLSGGSLHTDRRLMAKAARSRDVTCELDAQVRFLCGRDCTPDHADSHDGALYGTNGRLFFLNAFRVCRKHRLPFRFAKDPAFITRQFSGDLPPVLRAAHRAIVLAADAMRVPLLDDLVTHPRPVEKIDGFEALCGYYEKELAKSGPGITEVFLHPSLPDEDLCVKTPQWQKRVWEYNYLKSGRLNRFAEKEGFTLVSWKQAPFKKRQANS